MPKDVLVDALWGDRAPANPVRNLEILVVRARRALGDPSLIETGPAGYLFARTADCEVDAERFVELAEAGRRHLRAGRPDAALRAFREALDRWGGEPLPEDAYSDWAQEPRRELARRYLDTLEAAAVAALGAGDDAGAVLYAERAVGREPLRETSNLLLVQALAASGDTAGALRAFDSFRGTLAEEVGLDPSPQAMELQVRILRGEQLPEARMAGVSAAVPRAPTGESPFVGREAELAAVLQAADGAGPVLVSGPAGAGKSRLLAEAASRSPVPALSVRAFLAERAEPWTLGRSLVREALALDVDAARAVTKHGARALAEVIPEIEDLRDVPRLSIDPESRRALALEGAVQMAEASGARLVLVDDAQWADPTSLVLLVLLAERTGIGLVVAYRPEEVGSRTPLADAVEALLRGDARKVSLGPLPPGAVAGLVADRELARVIAEETDGTPLAVIEVLQALERDGWRCSVGKCRLACSRGRPAASSARSFRPWTRWLPPAWPGSARPAGPPHTIWWPRRSLRRSGGSIGPASTPSSRRRCGPRAPTPPRWRPIWQERGIRSLRRERTPMPHRERCCGSRTTRLSGSPTPGWPWGPTRRRTRRCWERGATRGPAGAI